MARYEVQEATIHSLLEVKRLLYFRALPLPLIQHQMELIKVLLDHFIVFVTNFAKLS